jgi:hypothetical protein
MKRLKFSSALALGLLLIGVQAAAAEGLFRPANLTDRAARALPATPPSAMKHMRITRNALLRVDRVYLRSHVAPANRADLVTPGQRNAAASRLSPDLTLQLFPDVTLQFRRDFVVSMDRNCSPGRAIPLMKVITAEHPCGLSTASSAVTSTAATDSITSATSKACSIASGRRSRQVCGSGNHGLPPHPQNKHTTHLA